MPLGRLVPSCSSRVFVGLNKPKGGAWDREKALDIVEAAARREFPGVTLTRGKGVYQGGAGEDTITLEILRTDFDPPDLTCEAIATKSRRVAADIRKRLGQDSVLVSTLDPGAPDLFTTETIRKGARTAIRKKPRIRLRYRARSAR